MKIIEEAKNQKSTKPDVQRLYRKQQTKSIKYELLKSEKRNDIVYNV